MAVRNLEECINNTQETNKRISMELDEAKTELCHYRELIKKQSAIEVKSEVKAAQNNETKEILQKMS